MIRIVAVVLIVGGLLLGTTGVLRAEEAPPRDALSTPTDSSLSSIDFFTGYGWGELADKEDNNTFPLLVSFNFDLHPLVEKINLHLPSALELGVEPFFNFMASPASNIETGVAFLLKIGFLPATARFQPYFKGGPGMDYMTLQTREQGAQFNFIEYAGLGFHYFYRNNWALTTEYRYRHLSNADLFSPNKGIDATFAVIGITHKF